MSNIDLILVTKDKEDSFQKLRYQNCSKSESRMEVKWKPNGKENGKYSFSYFALCSSPLKHTKGLQLFLQISGLTFFKRIDKHTSVFPYRYFPMHHTGGKEKDITKP